MSLQSAISIVRLAIIALQARVPVGLRVQLADMVPERIWQQLMIAQRVHRANTVHRLLSNSRMAIVALDSIVLQVQKISGV
jgi:hypothetical protein